MRGRSFIGGALVLIGAVAMFLSLSVHSVPLLLVGAATTFTGFLITTEVI